MSLTIHEPFISHSCANHKSFMDMNGFKIPATSPLVDAEMKKNVHQETTTKTITSIIPPPSSEEGIAEMAQTSSKPVRNKQLYHSIPSWMRENKISRTPLGN